MPDEPLFLTRYGTRLKTINVNHLCERVFKQALPFYQKQSILILPHINYVIPF